MRDMLWQSEKPSREQRDLTQPTWSWLSNQNVITYYQNMHHVGHVIMVTDQEMEFTAEILSMPVQQDFETRNQGERSSEHSRSMRVRAPMLRCRMRTPHCKSFFHLPALGNGNFGDEVRKLIEDGQWYPDIPDVDTARDIWALQWTREGRGLKALIVRPVLGDENKWFRIGMFEAHGLERSSEDNSFGESKTIELY